MTSLNPAEAGLTGALLKAYNIVSARQAKGKITKTVDVATIIGRDRSNAFRSLQALVLKGVIERYGSFFYRLPTTKGK